MIYKYGLFSLSVLASMLLVNQSQATLLLYEGFDYGGTGGSIETIDGGAAANGGSGWSGAWAADGGTAHEYNPTGLTYSNNGTLVTTGGALDDPGGTDYKTSRQYDVNLVGADGTYWFSYLLLTSNSALEEAKFESDGLRGGVGFGTDNGHSYQNGAYGAELNSTIDGTLTSTGLPVPATVSFVLGKIVYSSTGDETLSVWFDIDLTSTEGTLGTPDSIVTVAADTQGDKFHFTTGGGHVGTIDELRLGTTFGDVVAVVPEASTMALIGLAGMGLLLRRRK